MATITLQQRRALGAGAARHRGSVAA